MDSYEGSHGQNAPDAVKRQYTLELCMDAAIKERAKRDGVTESDVVRSAVAGYLEWGPYEYPRAARWTKESRGTGQRAGQ